MVRLRLALFGLLFASGRSAFAQGDLNVISAVRVKTDAGVSVEIVGKKKPNFTTFTMPDPFRLVIDIAEATFEGVPEEMPGSGAVSVVKTAAYGSDTSAIARVLIAFTKEVETDVQVVKDTMLVVKVAGSAPAVAMSTGGDSRAAEPERKQAAEEEAKRKVEEARLAREEEKKRKVEEARLAAEEEKKRKEDEKLKAEEKRLAEEEKKRKAEEARLAAEEEKKRKAEEKRLAEEEKKRKAEEARLAAEEEKRLAEATRKRQADPRVAMATASEPPPSSGDAIDVSARTKNMQDIGFRQLSGVSRVFVRTDEAVRYSLSDAGQNTVVLELQNTRIPARNNARFLDTSFFDNTAVALISPKAASKTVRVEIKLKENVPYSASQEGAEIRVDFQRPPGASGHATQ